MVDSNKFDLLTLIFCFKTVTFYRSKPGGK